MAVCGEVGNRTSVDVSRSASVRDKVALDSATLAFLIMSWTVCDLAWPSHTQAKGDRPSPKDTPVQAGLKERKTWSVILVVAKGRQLVVKGTSKAYKLSLQRSYPGLRRHDLWVTGQEGGGLWGGDHRRCSTQRLTIRAQPKTGN
jgi:hypothetical protein